MRLIFSVLLVLLSIKAFSQDIYDKNNSLKYLRYLESIGQYELLYPEYERLIFMEPDNDSLKLGLLSSFQKAGLYEKGIERTEVFFPDRSLMPVSFSNKYIKLLILNKSYNKAIAFDTTITSLPATVKADYLITIYLLNGQWKQAQELNKKATVSQLFNPVLQDIQRVHCKSPLLASGMSLVLPGSGKLYCGKLRDGIMSFVLVSLLSWQSYVGFHKKGVESVYGWVSGAAAAGFYLGDVYGSYKAARYYNEDKNNEIIEKVRAVTTNTY